MIATMAKGRKKDPNSKRSTGADRHTRPRVVFHPDADLLGQLDDFVGSVRPKTDRTSVIIMAIEEFLAHKKNNSAT